MGRTLPLFSIFFIAMAACFSAFAQQDSTGTVQDSTVIEAVAPLTPPTPIASQEDVLEDTIDIAPCYFDESLVGYEPADLIRDKMSCIENEVLLDYNAYTSGFINYFLHRKRSYINTMLERTDLYFPMIEAKLSEAGLPDELKYLSIIESGLNPRAQSPAGAVGLWQFVSSTGRMMGLRIDNDIDERMNAEKATVAAMKYLANLYNNFGDWRYAIAAYNCGPGNVRKAIRRSGNSSNFWTVYRYLPRETRGYVPQFMAVQYVMSYYEDLGLYPEKIESFPSYDTLTVHDYINLDTFCTLLGYCFEDLVALNPEIRKHHLPKNSGLLLKLPPALVDTLNMACIFDSCQIESTPEFNYTVRKYPGSTDGKERIGYRVRQGDYLGKIAARYDVSVSDLKKWNGIRGTSIRTGEVLSIWKSPSYLAKNNTKPAEKIEIPDSKYYVVQPGDTLWSISRKFNGISLEKIKQLNDLKDNNIKPGQKLVLGG